MQYKLPACVLKNGESDFGNGVLDVLNAVVGIPAGDYAEVYCGIDADGNIVFCDDGLRIAEGFTCLVRSSTLIFISILLRVSVQGLM